ncbi:hypothetical protein K239x_15200 [Planctomycetes bacterium K23_9]|uniref:Uncharacterized protein n=1 Tax=Stieleria marina TaxID=1930275 RepID=A0A517NR27_9BACT|nr:hypothetical protein K239x_15200 [Planctomycetes bacterium K23_9]
MSPLATKPNLPKSTRKHGPVQLKLSEQLPAKTDYLALQCQEKNDEIQVSTITAN